MQGPRSRPADLLLTNARVRSGPALAVVQPAAIAIGGGIILAVGPEPALARLCGRDTRRVDLAGALVLPGFVDTHTHLGWAGEGHWRVDWRGVRDRETAIERLRTIASRIDPGFWIPGGNWSRDVLPESELPALAELDAVTGAAPLFLVDATQSVALANSRALALFRLGADHPEPPGGTIERDATGQLTGRFFGASARARETAGVVPPRDRYRCRAELAAALRELARHGITEAHDIATLPDRGPTPLIYRERSFTDATLFLDLAERGELPARIGIRPFLERWPESAGDATGRWPAVSTASGSHTAGATKDVSSADGPGRRSGGRDGLLTLHGMKLFVDAGRYSPQPEGPRSFRYPGKAIALDWLRGAHGAQLSVSMHALGDLDVREALDLFELVQDAGSPEPAEAPDPAESAGAAHPWPRRHRIIHARRIAPADIPRLARLGVIVEAQPWDILEQLPLLSRRFDAAFLSTTYPFRSLLDAGVRLAFGSDWLIDHRDDGLDLDPLAAMWVATTRSAPRHARSHPEAAGPWQPEQSITVAEAVAGYTQAGAYAAGAERRRGTVRPDMDADLVALSHDVLAGGPPALLEARVVLTVVAGRVVYEAI